LNKYIFFKRASFQVVFAQNYTSSRAFVIFNYPKSNFNWTDNNKIVLISYSNGGVNPKVLKSGAAIYSNTETSSNPYYLFSNTGNTSNVF
jgi:hypothetical protein